ncbi:MAG: hypothetical protein M3256_20765, partial [Actinomycetota bacterium]|nr:hypothetical protein [Actinomycetota bacterium]
MTTERAVAVAAPLDEQRRLLVEDLRSAAARADGAEPGDRSDVVRFEALSSQLEAWAFGQVGMLGVASVRLDAPPSDGPSCIADGVLPTWMTDERGPELQSILDGGGVLVIVALPLEPGEWIRPADSVGAPPPAERWKSESDLRGSKAVEERFEFQLKKVTSSGGDLEPFSPSGIPNRVLTEALRRFVHAPRGSRSVDVPVQYRDGSRSAYPFPLRSVVLQQKAAERASVDVAFSLLSIRHTELDAIVDGAWLRNSQISQPRTAAETDDLVYALSCEQLTSLTAGGSRTVRIRMYQTGLETAIVGFYRAVTQHLIDHPGSLTVLPMYYRQPQKAPART